MKWSKIWRLISVRNFVNLFSSFVILGTHVLKLTNERRLRCSESFSPVRISLSHWDSVLHIRTAYTDTTYMMHPHTQMTWLHTLDHCSAFTLHSSHTDTLTSLTNSQSDTPPPSFLFLSFYCSLSHHFYLSSFILFLFPGLLGKEKSLCRYLHAPTTSPCFLVIIIICNFVLAYTTHTPLPSCLHSKILVLLLRIFFKFK